jgi:hypothetical protein
MYCPVCLKEFKNKNSYRAHNWRFHNPRTTYRTKKSTSIQTNFDTSNDLAESAMALPMAAATVGIAAASRGDGKKWLLLLLFLLALGILVWYIATKKAEEKRLART